MQMRNLIKFGLMSLVLVGTASVYAVGQGRQSNGEARIQQTQQRQIAQNAESQTSGNLKAKLESVRESVQNLDTKVQAGFKEQNEKIGTMKLEVDAVRGTVTKMQSNEQQMQQFITQTVSNSCSVFVETVSKNIDELKGLGQPSESQPVGKEKKQTLMLSLLTCVLVIVGVIGSVFACILLIKQKRTGDHCDSSVVRMEASLAEGMSSAGDVAKQLADVSAQFKDLRVKVDALSKKGVGGQDQASLGSLNKRLDQDIGRVLASLTRVEQGSAYMREQMSSTFTGLSRVNDALKATTDAFAKEYQSYIVSLNGKIQSLAEETKRLAQQNATLQEAQRKLEDDKAREAEKVEQLANLKQLENLAEIKRLTGLVERSLEANLKAREESFRQSVEVKKAQEIATAVTECRARIEQESKEALERKDQEIGTLRQSVEAIRRDAEARISRSENDCQGRLELGARQVADAQARLTATQMQLSQKTDEYGRLSESLRSEQAAVAALQTQYNQLAQRLYPAELLEKPGFEPLRKRLDDWSSKGYVGAEIARAALGLFASRHSVQEDTWTMALRDVSVGVVKALREEHADSAATSAELLRWFQFMNTLSDASDDQPCFFQLKLPTIGASVDSSWMRQTGGAQVTAVNCWAVFTAMGLRYMADVA